MPRPKLNDQHRAYIVKRLACFDGRKEIRDDLEAEYGISVTEAAIGHYNPYSLSGKKLSAKWRHVFDTTREAFLKNAASETPLANKAVRIRRLAKYVEKHEKNGNMVAAAETMVLIAKELGGSFTNLRQHTGKDGKPIQHDHTHRDVDTMTTDELHAEMDRIEKQRAGLVH